jgi:hypothetical protein
MKENKEVSIVVDIKYEFINLIDISILLLNELINQYQMYADRYRKMIINLEDLKQATLEEKLVTDFIYLVVTRMLDHNDPKILEDAILSINKFYCVNYRTV